jgi:ADP-ribose pyrophosphatase YjhB (NUDIX family)
MCLSTFLFVRRGPRILLGKYADNPKWEELAGMDPERRRTHSRGWTIPARQVKFGEDPRDTARHVGEEILGISGMRYSDPRVEVDLYPPKWAPDRLHYDIWFLVDATPPKGWKLEVPPWYAELEWLDPRKVPDADYARGHEDVVARWCQVPARAK